MTHHTDHIWDFPRTKQAIEHQPFTNYGRLWSMIFDFLRWSGATWYKHGITWYYMVLHGITIENDHVQCCVSLNTGLDFQLLLPGSQRHNCTSMAPGKRTDQLRHKDSRRRYTWRPLSWRNMENTWLVLVNGWYVVNIWLPVVQHKAVAEVLE